MCDLSVQVETGQISCLECQTPAVLELCFKGNGALAHPRAKNAVRMVLGCQCSSSLQMEVSCPDCGEKLIFSKQLDGTYLAPHEHCEGRKYAHGL